MPDVRRRQFITLVAGAAAWPVAARAQQAGKVYRIGVLSPSSASVDSIRAITLAELAKAGFVEGQNLVLDARAGAASQIPELARALVAGNPDAIIAVSNISIGAMKMVTATVPIVMSFGTDDPVAAGFAASRTSPV